MGIVLPALLTEQDRSQAVSLSSQRKRDLIISMASMVNLTINVHFLFFVFFLFII